MYERYLSDTRAATLLKVSDGDQDILQSSLGFEYNPSLDAILYVHTCNQNNICYINELMIRTNQANVEYGFEYSIVVLRQSKLNNASYTFQQTKGMAAEYRPSLGGAVLAAVYFEFFFIMPVSPHDSMQALRYADWTSFFFERVKFHPTEDKVYFLTKEDVVGAGYHTIIITTDADNNLVYQTGSPYIFNNGVDHLWVTDIAWIKFDYSEVLLLSCLADDCTYEVMLLSKIDDSDHKILYLDMA